MDKSIDQLELGHKRQYAALSEISDEVMSMLHAHQLRDASLDSETVKGWLRLLYDLAQVGLGGKPHFEGKDDK